MYLESSCNLHIAVRRGVRVNEIIIIIIIIIILVSTECYRSVE
jgi:hypothetical protein